MRLSRYPASLADPETSLPHLPEPFTGQINPFYTSSIYLFIYVFIYLRTVLIMPNPLRLDLLWGFINSGFQNNCYIRFSSILFVLNTYLFTPWSRVILEKLTGSQQEFPRLLRNPKVHYCNHLTEPDRLSPCPHIQLPEDPL